MNALLQIARDSRLQSTSVKLAAALLAVFAFFLIGVRPASAFTCTFSSNGGGSPSDWNTTANWANCNSAAPSAGDIVIIPTATSVTMAATPTASAVSSIEIQGTGTLTLSSSAVYVAATSTVAVAGTFNINAGAASTTGLYIATGGTMTITTGAASTTSMTNNGTLNIMTGVVTSTGNVSSTGAVAFSSNGLWAIFGNVTSTGTFTAGTSTLRFLGADQQTANGSSLVFYNVLTDKSAGSLRFVATSTIYTLTTQTGGTVDAAAAGGFRVISAATIGASTTFLLNAATSTLGDVDNFGTVTITSGSATTTNGSVYTNRSGATTSLTTGTLALGGNFTQSGTWTPGTSKVRFTGGSVQTISGSGLIFNNLEVNKTTSNAASITSTSTVLGTLVTSGSGELSVSSTGAFTVLGAITNGSGVTIAIGSGSSTNASTFANNGTLSIYNGTVTSTGAFTNAGTITFTGPGMLSVSSTLADSSGTFTPGTNSTLRVFGDGPMTLAGYVYANLQSIKTGGTITFAASSTVTGTATMSGADTWSVNGVGIGVQVGNAWTIPSGSTLTIGAGSATSSAIFTNSGTVTITTGALHLADSFAGTGTFTPGTGAVELIGSGTVSIPGKVYYNLISTKTGSGNVEVTASSTVIGALVTSGAHTFSVTSTGGMNIQGAVSIGSGTTYAVGVGTSTNASTFTNSGTVSITTGTVTSTGTYVNTGTTSLTTGTLSLGGDFTSAGTFTPGTGTLRLHGGSAQSIPAVVYYNLQSIKSGQTVTFTASSTVVGTATLSGLDTWSVGSAGVGVQVGNAWTIPSGSTLTVGAGSATSSAALTNAGTVTIGTGRLNLATDLTSTGTFTPGTGIVEFFGTANGTSTGLVFNNIISSKTGSAVLATSASSTIMGTLVTSGAHTLSVQDAGGMKIVGAATIGSGTTYLVNAGTSTNVSTLANAGTITITSGSVTSTGNATSTGTLSLTSGNLELGGDFNNSGTFTPGTGKTKFTAGSSQAITGSGLVFNNLESVKSAGTASINSSSTVIGTLITSIGGTVSVSGAGGFRVVGAITNGSGVTLDIGAGTSTNDSTVANAGTMTISTGTATSTGTYTNTGTLTFTGAGTLSLGADFTQSGTFTPSTGTIRAFGTGTQALGAAAAAGNVYYNLATMKTAGTATINASSTVEGTLIMSSGGGTLDVTGAGGMTIQGAATIGTGSTYLVNAATSTNASTFSNSGTVTITTGTVTSTGAYTNAGTTSLTTGTLSLGGDFSSAGTYTPGTGVTRLHAGNDQSLAGVVYYTMNSIKSGGTATFAASSTVVNTLTTSIGGTLSASTFVVTVTGAATIGGSTTVTSTSGSLNFSAAVTSTGSLGSSSGATLFSSTFVNNGTFDVGSGNATSTGHATSTAPGTINGRSGTYTILADFNNDGTLNGQSGTTRFKGGSDQRLAGSSASTNMYNLTVDKSAGTVTLLGNATSTGTFTVTAGTWAVGNNRFAATGPYANTAGTVSIGASGRIVHSTDNSIFSTSAGVAVSTLSTPGSIYITLTDPNRNLLSGTIETMTVTVKGDGTSGGDSESLTLTETGAATGIFRNSTAMNLVASSGSVSLGNGKLEIMTNGTGYGIYTDTQDDSDVVTTSTALTFALSTGGSTGGGGGGTNVYGGGGGGGGGGGAAVTNQTSSSTNTLLANLGSIGVSVHNLVKLPDDGNLNTQEDSAVYYVGKDGKRHAFPNSKAYFTWYNDFSGVQVINLAGMASIPLGSNVTYKPGVKMVKFTTLANTYAVDKGGVLRWVKTEAAAVALYGSNWNTKIDDINDAFYVNYKFGADIDGLADYNPVTAQASVAYVSDSLQ